MVVCTFCKVEKAADQFARSFPHPRYGMWCKECERNRASIRRHGMTVAQKQKIADHHGGCAICGHSDPGTKGWTVDHDHQCCSGENSCPKCRRGVLCGWCNKMLGAAFDRPQILSAAIAYLERHASGSCDWHMPLACAPSLCTEITEKTNEESLVTSENESQVSNVGGGAAKNG